MADLVVDSDILIDTARGVQDAVNFLQEHAQQSVLAISSVTQMELLVGCRNTSEQRIVEQFLKRFTLFKLDPAITDLAVDLLLHYRLSHGLQIPDALIAATAMAINKPLASKNQRDDRFIAGLSLLPYP